jgi:hypothetical protein
MMTTLEALKTINKKKIEKLQEKLGFKETMKKEGWGKWMLRKLGEGANWVRKHPIKTTVYVLLAAAAVAAGVGVAVAVQAYMLGGWEKVLADLGLQHMWGKMGMGKATEVMGKALHGTSEIAKEIVPDIDIAAGQGQMP